MDDNQAPQSPDVTQNLTNWSNEPTIATLKGDLESSKSAHDTQISKINKWNNLLSVTGEARPPKVKGRSSVQPKLIRRQAEWRYSALSEPFLNTPKLFKISPVTFEDAKAAPQNELVLNWQFRTKLNKVKFIDDYVHSVTDEGTVIVRLGWKRVTKVVQEPAPIYEYYPVSDPQSLQAFQQALDARSEDHRDFTDNAPPELTAALEYYDETGQVTTAVQNGTEMVEVEKVIENKPTTEVLNPANVFIDPSCNGDFDKALFVIVSFETNQAELKKEPQRYKNLDKVNWEGNTPLAQPDHETSTPDTFSFNDKLRKKVVAYEYWGFYDINNTGELVPFVATWIGSTMIRMELNPFPDEKLPFVVVPYLPVKRNLYGEPDAEVLEDNQKLVGAVTRGMVDLLGRSANGQQGFAKGMLDPLNRRRYDNGQDYEFNPNVSPNAGLIEHKFPEIPQSALVMLNLQNQDAEALTGVKSFSGGLSGESYGNVATGIRGAIDAASKRETSILRRLAQGMQEIGSKIIAMNSIFLSEEEVIRVTNEDFVKVKREDIKGNFDLEVDISTAEVDEAKARDLGFMLQTIGPNMDPSISTMLLAEIADLKRMPELAHKLKTWKPQPDPYAEQMKQLELQKLQAEIAEINSQVQANLASANKSKSDADKKNLDYVEQETGTTHARNMEQQGAQARANQNLEITKALVKPPKEGEKKPNVGTAIGFNQLSDILEKGGSQGNVESQLTPPPQTQPFQ